MRKVRLQGSEGEADLRVRRQVRFLIRLHQLIRSAGRSRAADESVQEPEWRGVPTSAPLPRGQKNVSQMQVLVHSLHSVDHPASSEDAARAPRSLLSVRRVLLKLLRQRATTWHARAEHMETHRLLKRRKSDLTHDRRHRVGLTKQRNSSVHLVRASVPSLDCRTARPVDFAGTHHAVVRRSADGDPRGVGGVLALTAGDWVVDRSQHYQWEGSLSVALR